MPSAAAPTKLRLSSPADILTMIPYQLGFHPAKSLVVMSLRGPGKRAPAGVTFRVDLDLGPGQLAALTVEQLRRDDAQQAVLVLYDPPAPDGGIPGAEIAAALGEALEKAEIPLLDFLRVVEGHWWSYLCRNSLCCPPWGTPLVAADQPGASAVAASAVLAGLAVAPDRESLAASLDPPAPWTREAVAQAGDRVELEMAARIARGEQTQVRQGVLAILRTARARISEPKYRMSDVEVASVALGLFDKETRDEVCTWVIRDDAPALQRVLTEVVRRVGPPDSVPAATVLAMCAYAQGNGAMAGIALDHALAAEPGYTLAQQIDTSLRGGVPPDEIRALARDVKKELALQRRTRRGDGGAGRSRGRSAG
jgi:hypothetical protein